MTKIITVSTNDFILDTSTGKYVATIAADTLGFNKTKFFKVSKFLKNVSGTYHNIILAYEISLNGDLIIYSDDAITGRLIIETDT